jgi:hypothetical protein
VLPMVRVDRLYLGPMSAPDQLGSDKFKPIVVLGRELLPAVASAPVSWACRRPRPPMLLFAETKGHWSCFRNHQATKQKPKTT